MNQRGSAAAQCGKAAPFRRCPFSFEAAPQMGGVASSHLWRVDGKAEPYRTVRRQSRSRRLTVQLPVSPFSFGGGEPQKYIELYTPSQPSPPNAERALCFRGATQSNFRCATQ